MDRELQRLVDTHFADIKARGFRVGRDEFTINQHTETSEGPPYQIDMMIAGIDYSARFGDTDKYAALLEELNGSDKVIGIFATMGGLLSPRPFICGLQVTREGEVYKAEYTLASPVRRSRMTIGYMG